MYEELKELIDSKQYYQLKEKLLHIEPADIAITFEDLTERERALLFRLLPKETAAEVFVELDSDMQTDLIEGFSDSELKEVVDELYVDDAVDIIEEMPANVVTRILRHAAPEMRYEINQMLKYPADSAGSIMTTEFVDLKKDMTVMDAFTHIRRTGIDKETIYICYVMDKNRILEGIISVKDLLLADYSCVIGDIMETDVIHVKSTDDQEYAARTLNKYDLLALPVTDNENRLIGIITVDDAIDVLQEENTEDIEKMAAITPSDKPYLKMGVFETFLQRIPWLLILMISAAFTGAIITSFESALATCTVLTAFIPMLMDTGGNSGSQASVTIIRGLSLGDIEFRDIMKVVFKEVRVAFLCGLALAIANFAKLMFIDRVDIMVAAVVCLTLVCTVVFAKIMGCTLPMIAKKIGFDPAVMASPFITTIVDAMSLLIYFKIATQILNI